MEVGSVRFVRGGAGRVILEPQVSPFDGSGHKGEHGAISLGCTSPLGGRLPPLVESISR